MASARHEALIAAAAGWARADERVRALLLKGSLGRSEGDERSDIDFVVVTCGGRLDELWAERRRSAEQLGRWLGGFDEVPWQAPHTFIGFYDGPVKVDFFYQEGEPDADPWLRDGFKAIVDPDGLAERLRTRLTRAHGMPELSDFDAHAWDWWWWLDVKLARRGETWLVYVELVKFIETILISGYNALGPEPWRGASGIDARLPADVRKRLEATLPRSPDPVELRRALDTALEHYLTLRGRLADERGMPLAAELARQVLTATGH